MCSHETLLKMASRWPALASKDANDVIARLMSLKAPYMRPCSSPTQQSACV